MQYEKIMKKLKSHSNAENVRGMVRFGINPKNTLGVSIPVIRKMAKDIGAIEQALKVAEEFLKKKDEK